MVQPEDPDSLSEDAGGRVMKASHVGRSKPLCDGTFKVKRYEE